MGEIAEMMLDGTMCEGCGEFLDGESPGYPRYCSKQCAEDRGVEDEDEASIENTYIYLDVAICSINNAIDMIKKLKLKRKVKELNWLIKRIELYKLKLEE